MPTGHTHRQPYPDTPRHRTPGHATQTPIYDAMVDALTRTRDNDLHAMPDVHNGPVHDPHTLLPHGEVLVALPYKPAFPGVLDPGVTPTATAASPTDSPDTPGGHYTDIALRCRRSVAQWIGVYLTSFYGSAQVRYEWRGEVLAIFDDPWSYPEEHPRLVCPDDDGRYAIIQPWLGVSASYGKDLVRRHPEALAIMAGDQWPGSTVGMTSVMAAYLCDHPGAHDRQHQSLEAAITKLVTP